MGSMDRGRAVAGLMACVTINRPGEYAVAYVTADVGMDLARTRPSGLLKPHGDGYLWIEPVRFWGEGPPSDR